MQVSKLVKFARVAFLNGKEGFISEDVQNFSQASFSGFLSIAAFMCHYHPNLNPPGCPVADTNYIEDEEFPSPNLSMNKYFEPWCDFFNSLLQQNHEHGRITEKDHVLYLICKVQQNYFTVLEKELNRDKFKPFNSDQVENLLQISKFSTPLSSKIKVGIINFSASQLKKDPFIPKVNLLSLFTGIWYQHTDSWRSYDVLKQQYPSQDDIMKTDIFILTGSTFSVNDNTPQVQKIMEMLKSGAQKNKKLKILGICFGHQAIAHYFGGKVVKRNLYPGIEVIKFNCELMNNSYFDELLGNSNKQLLVNQFHSDYVESVPNGFSTLASSKSCEHESMISNDGRILTFQFHCQYTKQYTYGLEARRKKYSLKYHVYDEKEVDREILQKYGLERHHETCYLIRDVVRKFIQWKVPVNA